MLTAFFSLRNLLIHSFTYSYYFSSLLFIPRHSHLGKGLPVPTLLISIDGSTASAQVPLPQLIPVQMGGRHTGTEFSRLLLPPGNMAEFTVIPTLSGGLKAQPVQSGP